MKKEKYVRLYRVAKRGIDILLSVISLAMFSPIMLIISLLLKIQGDGPVLFKQERLGQDGRLFEILKFRSMRQDAPNLASKDIDEKDYVTPVGRILRMTSLDELPQLYNILKGEMSFVGPRPLIPNEGEINMERSKMGILKLRPGLTGWAQIMARNTEDQAEKLSLDLYYMCNKCIMLDLKIIVLTAFAMINRK